MTSLTRKNNILLIGISAGITFGLSAGVISVLSQDTFFTQDQNGAYTAERSDLSIAALKLMVMYAANGLLVGGGISKVAAETYGFFSGRINPRWLCDKEESNDEECTDSVNLK